MEEQDDFADEDDDLTLSQDDDDLPLDQRKAYTMGTTAANGRPSKTKKTAKKKATAARGKVNAAQKLKVAKACQHIAPGANVLRKNRWTIPDEARRILQDAYIENKYPLPDEIIKIADSIESTSTRVKVWFQNQRQRYRAHSSDFADMSDSKHVAAPEKAPNSKLASKDTKYAAPAREFVDSSSDDFADMSDDKHVAAPKKAPNSKVASKDTKCAASAREFVDSSSDDFADMSDDKHVAAPKKAPNSKVASKDTKCAASAREFVDSSSDDFADMSDDEPAPAPKQAPRKSQRHNSPTEMQTHAKAGATGHTSDGIYNPSKPEDSSLPKDIRGRWSIPDETRSLLDAAYAESCYPSADKIAEMAQLCSTTPRRVKVWFQNQRQKNGVRKR